MLQRVTDVRALLKTAERQIQRVKNKEIRASLQYDYQQAEVPVIEAVHYAHAFVFADTEERLAIAAKRAEALNERLANPPSTSRPQR
jgi:hypothetical protein